MVALSMLISILEVSYIDGPTECLSCAQNIEDKKGGVISRIES